MSLPVPCRNKNHCTTIMWSLDRKDNGLGFIKLEGVIDYALKFQQCNSIQ